MPRCIRVGLIARGLSLVATRLFVVGLLVTVAVAQDDPRKKKVAAPGDLPIAELKGKVKEVKLAGPGVAVVEMTDADDKTYYIKVEPKKTKVKVEGTALVSFLRPGMHVRLTAFLLRNAVKDPVSQLQLFAPEDGYQVGIFKDDPTDNKADSLIAGQVKSVKGKTMMLNAGGKQVKVTLAEDAQIELTIGDVTLARPGDTITVLGRVVQAPDQILGMEVDVELVEPLAGAEPAKKGRAAKSPRDKKPAADEAEEKPGA